MPMARPRVKLSIQPGEPVSVSASREESGSSAGGDARSGARGGATVGGVVNFSAMDGGGISNSRIGTCGGAGGVTTTALGITTGGGVAVGGGVVTGCAAVLENTGSAGASGGTEGRTEESFKRGRGSGSSSGGGSTDCTAAGTVGSVKGSVG